MLHLGSIRGTSIDIDFSFIILIIFFMVINYDPARGIEYALIWAPVLFISILVHELAHAATIGLFGFGSSHILLGGMGGVTVNQRRARPWQDMLISLAGPFSSFGLMLLSRWILYNVPYAQKDKMLIVLLPYMVWANLWWGIFNLIPVPPLDGGHATRDFFRMFLDERKAFVIAIWIAIVVGGAVAIQQFVTGAFFIGFYIAWFVFMAWQQWEYFRKHGIPGS